VIRTSDKHTNGTSRVAEAVASIDCTHVILLQGDEPLLKPDHVGAMIDAMRRADLILSDSGGVQEEAPALGVPLLVLRDKTERPECIATGNALLVGTDTHRVIEAVTTLNDDRAALAAMASPRFPFGDGQSAPRIAALALAWLDRRGEDQRRALSA